MLRKLLLIAASVALLLIGSPLTAQANGTTWSVAPANASGPDGRISLRHELKPGGSVTDYVAVTNSSRTAATFIVAAGDGVIGEGGAFDLSTTEPKGSGKWISLGGISAGQLKLAAGETRVLPVKITVPADATPGDHPAGLVVGLRSGEGGVTVQHRIGVRAHLRVAGDVNPALDLAVQKVHFEPSWIPFAPGKLTVDYQLSNSGNVRLGAVASVDVAGQRVTADAVELLPGTSAQGSLETTISPTFWLKGSLTAQPTVIGQDKVQLPTAATANISALAVSWSGMAVIGLVTASAALLIVRRRAAAKAAN